MGREQIALAQKYTPTPEGVRLGEKVLRWALISLAATLISVGGAVALLANW